MTRPCFHNDNNRDRLDSAVFGFFLGLRNFSFKVTSINSEKAIESLLQDTGSTILHKHLFFSCDIHTYRRPKNRFGAT